MVRNLFDSAFGLYTEANTKMTRSTCAWGLASGVICPTSVEHEELPTSSNGAFVASHSLMTAEILVGFL